MDQHAQAINGGNTGRSGPSQKDGFERVVNQVAKGCITGNRNSGGPGAALNIGGHSYRSGIHDQVYLPVQIIERLIGQGGKTEMTIGESIGQIIDQEGSSFRGAVKNGDRSGFSPSQGKNNRPGRAAGPQDRNPKTFGMIVGLNQRVKEADSISIIA